MKKTFLFTTTAAAAIVATTNANPYYMLQDSKSEADFANLAECTADSSTLNPVNDSDGKPSGYFTVTETTAGKCTNDPNFSQVLADVTAGVQPCVSTGGVFEWSGAAQRCPLPENSPCTATQYCYVDSNSILCNDSTLEGTKCALKDSTDSAPVAVYQSGVDSLTCEAATAGDVQIGKNGNVYGQYLYTFQGPQAKVDQCIAEIQESTALTRLAAADACFDSSFMQKWGATEHCPLEDSEICTEGQFCQSQDQNESKKCPTDGKPCAFQTAALKAYKFATGKTEADLPSSCGPSVNSGVTQTIIKTNEDPQMTYIAFAGEQAKVDMCVAEASATISEAPSADACFTEDQGTITANHGASAVCPLEWDESCTTGQYCAAPIGGKSEVCPSDSKCPEKDPDASLAAYTITTAPTCENVEVQELTTPFDQKFATLKGKKSAVDACVTANSLATASAMDACFDATTFAATPGAAKECPLAYEAVCAETQFCQGGDDAASSTLCPQAELKCPKKAVDPPETAEHVLKIEQKRGYHYQTGTPEDPIPAGWTQFLNDKIAQAQTAEPDKWAACQSSGLPSATWPTSKNGHNTITLLPVAGDCDRTWYGNIAKDAKAEFNKDKLVVDQYKEDVPSYSSFKAEDYNNCLADQELKCKANLDTCLQIPCEDSIACTENKQCGSGFCNKPDGTITAGVCASNALASVIAPAVAALVALALF